MRGAGVANPASASARYTTSIHPNNQPPPRSQDSPHPNNPCEEESPYNEIFIAADTMRFSRLFPLIFALTAPLLAWQQGHGGEGDMGEQLKSLLRVSDPSTGFILVALGVSFLAGAAHALTPWPRQGSCGRLPGRLRGNSPRCRFPGRDRDDHAHRGGVRARRRDHLRYSALLDGYDLRLVCRS